MFISNKYNFLFIHIPKTGGTALRSCLINSGIEYDSRLMKGTPRHETFLEFVNRTGTARSVSTWAVVRDPVERFLSWHRYVRQKGNIWKIPNDANRFAMEVCNNRWNAMHGVTTQSHFVEGAKNLNIIKYEQLGKGMLELKKFLNVNLDLSVANASKPEKQILSDSTIDCLKQYYEEDYTRFGYET